MWLYLKNLISYCIETYVPTRVKQTAKHNPWITREIIHHKRKIRRMRKAKNKKREVIEEITRTMKRLLKEAKERFFGVTLHDFLKSSPGKFWRYLSNKKEQIEQIIVDDVVVTEGKEIANKFNEFFQSVFTKDDQQSRIPISTSATPPQMTELIITQNGIFDRLLHLDPKKAHGPDKIPGEFLRKYAEWLSFYLETIFNKSLETSTLPCDWLRAKVVPIFKSGNRLQINNYRPVSLTSSCCKVMEHIVAKHIIQFLDSNSFLYPRQHGFRAGLSTTTQLVETFHDFASAMNSKQQIDVISIDFSKAFDRVSHRKLLTKLKMFGLNENITSWIRAYLRNRSQTVEVRDAPSYSLSVTSGVPQGSVLGPLLFLLYINDISTVIKPPVQINLFADDCLVYSPIKTSEDQAALNDSLDYIKQWCFQWQMEINFKKSSYTHVTNKKNVSLFQYHIGNVELTKAETFKYLGVTISRNLKWQPHIINICAAAYRKLCMLRNKLKNSNEEIKLTAYKTLIRPTLEYASVVWDPATKTDIDRLERIQRKAARFITSNYKSTSSVTEMLSACGLEPLAVRRKIARLKFLFLIYHGQVKINRDTYLRNITNRSARLNHSKALQSYLPRIDVFKYSFFANTINDWNKLPEHIVSHDDVSVFEDAVRLFYSV